MFTAEFNLARVIAQGSMTLKIVGEQNGIGPLKVYDRIREAAAGNLSAIKAHFVGAGRGRMSLAEACSQNGLSVGRALGTLRQRGIESAPEQKLRKIAENAGVTPTELMALLKAG